MLATAAGSSPPPPERFYSLDVLRGVAALSVVFWHWQFFFTGLHFDAALVRTLPLGQVFEVVYLKGWRAVDLFFGLSGFVFYWLYAQSIRERRIGGWRFAVLRFSRLYPLHFVTLVFIAVVELAIIRKEGAPVGAQNIDLEHFVAQVFLVSSWVYPNFDDAMSFNGPIWSVSVEAFLYALFLVVCRFLPVRALTLIVLSVLGFAIGQRFELSIGRGMGSFFLGGCTYLLYQTIARSARLRQVTVAVVGLTLCLWIASLIGYARDFDPASRVSNPLLQRGVAKAIVAWPVLVLFPLTILSLALSETVLGALGRRLSFVGDVSYSSYLLHAPLQIVFYLVLQAMGLGLRSEIYRAGWFMLVFFALLTALSLLSHRYFEMPMQRSLRSWLVPKRQGAVPA